MFFSVIYQSDNSNSKTYSAWASERWVRYVPVHFIYPFAAILGIGYVSRKLCLFEESFLYITLYLKFISMYLPG